MDIKNRVIKYCFYSSGSGYGPEFDFLEKDNESPWLLVCWPLDPNVAGSKLGQGDGFLNPQHTFLSDGK
jgi:hypothetical protein